MGIKANSVMLSESESFWPRFKSRLRRKSKKRSSKPNPSSNYAVEISPARLVSGKSDSSVKIVSISRDGEFIPVILSSVEKVISDEKPLGLDAVEIKVQSRDAKTSVKSRQSEVSIEELAPKQGEVAVKKSVRRSWVRIAKVFRFPTAPDLHRTKVSQDCHRAGHAKNTEMPVIEQPKGLEILQENEVADSIPRPIDHPSKFNRASAEVDSKSFKLLKSFGKLSSPSRASTPQSSFKGRQIKSGPLSSSSPYPQLSRPDINSTPPNFQPKKLNMSADRKGTITGDAAAEGEGYDMAINLSVLIIIMACLVFMFSGKLLAVVCTSLWWYLLPSLLKKYSVSAAAADVQMESSILYPKQWRRRSVSDVNSGLHRSSERRVCCR